MASVTVFADGNGDRPRVTDPATAEASTNDDLIDYFYLYTIVCFTVYYTS